MNKLIMFLALYFSLLFASAGNHFENSKEWYEIRSKPFISKEEYTCFVDNLYYEARGEGYKGMQAVGHVVMNRMKDPRWPKTYCKIIYQKKQFSWTNPGQRQKPERTAEARRLAERVALDVLFGRDGGTHGVVADATAFHSAKMPKRPYWAKMSEKIAVVGNHIFYRLPDVRSRKLKYEGDVKIASL